MSACPPDYAPAISLEPATRLPKLSSAADQEVRWVGTKTITHSLDNGEDLTTRWNVCNVHSLIISTEDIVDGGGSVMQAKDKRTLHTPRPAGRSRSTCLSI